MLPWKDRDEKSNPFTKVHKFELYNLNFMQYESFEALKTFLFTFSSRKR